MANSLLDQLLKVGLVTQEQADKATQPQPKPSKPVVNKGKKPQQPHPRPNRPPMQAQDTGSKAKSNKPSNRSPTDLAQFYQQRDQLERNEREEEERLRQERAARKKQTREEIKTLITGNTLNAPETEAEIRYNFVVGENIKYVYVTEAQQVALAQGELAITFLEGKRCIIPVAIAQQIQQLDPEKIIVINQGDGDMPLDQSSEPVSSDSAE